LKAFFQEAVPEEDTVPGAVIAIQSFGDFLGFNPHLHIPCTDGCFYRNAMFRVGPRFETKDIEEIFRHNVFKMLLSKGIITQDLVSMLLSWRHCGFNVFCGPRIHPREEEAMENLARYIIRASFSQERMTYIKEESKISYQSKDGKEEQVFDALEWLAAMCSHVPNKGEQMVRYYGLYSNVSRGKQKKQDEGGMIPSILEPDGSSKEHRKNWARSIQKIYAVDPLTCPKCQGRMRILAFIEDDQVIKKILRHLGLWDIKAKPSPKRANAPPKYIESYIDYSVSQLPLSDNLSRASRSNEWLYVDPECPRGLPHLISHIGLRLRFQPVGLTGRRVEPTRPPRLRRSRWRVGASQRR
jgi:hypothetical protein